MSSIQRCLLGLLLLLSNSVLAAVDADESLALVTYAGFGGTQQFEIEGRVLEREDEESPATLQDGLFDNLWRNLGLLSNDEKAGVKVTLAITDQYRHVITDEEGYFRFNVSLPEPISPGWTTLSLSASGIQPTTAEVLLVPPDNTLGIITDIDDTLMVSTVTDTAELLQNTFLKNPLQRVPVSGAAGFLAALAAGRGPADLSADNSGSVSAPIFYLSASPRQFYGNIRRFLEYHAFPKGVLIAKKVSDESDSEPLLDQFTYKTTHIESLLHSFPWMQFILIGDDGEKDPEIYQAIQMRFPDRIVAVYIHKVVPFADRLVYAGQRDLMQAIETLTPVK